MVVRFAILSVLTATALPIVSAEEAAVPRWHMDNPKILFADSEHAGRAADFVSYFQVVKVVDTAGPVLQIGCSMNNQGRYALSAAIQLDPANKYEEDPKRTFRINTMSGHLTVGNETKAERWRYHAQSTKMVPFDSMVPRRLFNAVVKNAPVHLKTRTDKYALDIPEMDATFRHFAKTCAVTNGGHFDPNILDEAHSLGAQSEATSDN